MNKVDSSKILISIGYDLYLNYDSIIGVISPDMVNDSYVFKKKKILKTKEQMTSVKSYIYCKDDYLIATNIEETKLKEKINKIMLSSFNNKIFEELQ